MPKGKQPTARETPPQVTVREKPREAPQVTVREKPREAPQITVRETPRETPQITVRERGKLPTAREKTPEKVKLPTAKGMEVQILAALQELNGVARYTDIDARVKENLKRLAPGYPFDDPSQSFYETAFADKCAKARRALRKQGFLKMGAKKGHWRFSHIPPVKPPKAPAPSKMQKFAEDAIKLLDEQGVPPAVINSFRELRLRFEMDGPDVQPSDRDKLEVEAKAIAFILDLEKDWQRPENRNNPGFDLYRTQSGRKNGKITAWCEVKSLSGKFSSVSLTHTEFKEALKRGKDYWLYIVENVGNYDPEVENAGSDDPKVENSANDDSKVENADNDGPTLIKINDPAGKAERFTYRHPAWRRVAEEVIHANQEKLPL